MDRAVKIFSDLDIDGDGDITEVRDVIFGLPGVYSLQFNREPLSNQNFVNINSDFSASKYV